MKRLLERDLKVVAQVRAAADVAALPAATTAPAAAHELAEDVLEDVGEALEALLGAAAAAVLERRLPEAIVRGALLRILQAVVGLAHGLEPVLAVLAARIAIGMTLHRDPAVGRLDRLVVGGALDLEQLVIFGISHRKSPRPPVEEGRERGCRR